MNKEFKQSKTNKMKQLFCVIITDPDYVIGLESPIVYHVECDSQEQVEAFVIKDLSSPEYRYELEDIAALDIFSYPIIIKNFIKI